MFQLNVFVEDLSVLDVCARSLFAGRLGHIPSLRDVNVWYGRE